MSYTAASKISPHPTLAAEREAMRARVPGAYGGEQVSGSGGALRRAHPRRSFVPAWLSWQDTTRVLVTSAMVAVLLLRPAHLRWTGIVEVGGLYAMAQAAFWALGERRLVMRRAVLVRTGIDVVFIAAAIPFTGLGRSPVLVLFALPVATVALVVGLRWGAVLATTCLVITALVVGPPGLIAAREHVGALAVLLYGTAVVVAGVNRRNRRARGQARRMARGVTTAVQGVESGTDLPSVLSILGELALQVTGSSRGAIVLEGSPGEEPDVPWSAGLSPAYLAAARAVSLGADPLIARHPQADARLGPLRAPLRLEGSRAVIALPLFAAGRLAGRMELHFASGLLDATVALNMAGPFATYAGMALEQERHRQLLMQWSRRLAEHHARAMDRSDSEILELALADSLRVGRQLTGAQLAAAAVWGREGDERLITDGGDEGAQAGLEADVRRLLEQVRHSDQPVRAMAGPARPEAAGSGPSPPGVRSFLGVPIHHLTPAQGALIFVNRRFSPGFTVHDEQLGLTVAAQLAATLQVPRFVREQSARSDALLHLLTEITDAREKAVYGHSTRVSQYARTLGAGLGLDAATLERTVYGGLLHDVGKIAIPDAILYKPGALDDAERALMMTHAAIGADIVAEAGDLASVAPAVRHHHEWWDGHGYPDGLAGVLIPVEARVITVADALDAMTTDRPYRPACSLEEAVARIRAAAGTQFDPAVVDVLERDLASVKSTARSAPAAGTGHSLASQQADAQIAAWRVFRKLGERLRAVLDVTALGQVVDGLLAEEMHAVAHSLLVLDAGGGLLRAASTHRDVLDFGLGSTLPRGRGLAWAALQSDRPLVLDDVESDPRYALARTGEHHAGVFLPLTSLGGQPQGVLVVYRSLDEPFKPEDVEKLQAIGVAIGEAVAVAQLHEHTRRRG